MKSLNLLFLILLAGGISSLTASGDGQDAKKKDHYTAVAVGTGGVAGGGSLSLDIRIEEYTSDEEAMRLVTLLKDEGQDALRLELEKIKKGKISPRGQVGTDIAVARLIETETARIIRIFTARPMSFIELRRSGRSRDYPFGLIELMVDRDGNGQGAVVVSAQIKFNKENSLELESLGNQYVKLSNVRKYK